MKTAILSDVHSNLPALEAVLQDIEEHGVTRRICLGDTVGYNAEPAACLALVRKSCEIVIQGNHDLACSGSESIDEFNDMARAGIEYSRENLSAADKFYLRGLPVLCMDGKSGYVHASLDEPGEFRYVTTGAEARSHFREQQVDFIFSGHTHRPIVWVMHKQQGLGVMEAGETVELPDSGKYFINVGSVGQNREGSPAACYVLFDLDSREIEYRRIPYDVGTAQKRILDAGLPQALAVRLQRGR